MNTEGTFEFKALEKVDLQEIDDGGQFHCRVKTSVKLSCFYISQIEKNRDIVTHILLPVSTSTEETSKWRAHFVYTHGKERSFHSEYIDIPNHIMTANKQEHDESLIGFCDAYIERKYGHESQQYSIFTYKVTE